ncbi:MAG TPA: hypothetical protein VGN17_29735 [Bryobacteraceae bacterium]|jgi:hypothetical protein
MLRLYWALLFVFGAVVLRAADPLPVVPMKGTPEELARSFVVQQQDSCDRSVVIVCPEFFTATDVTLRWVQLDDDEDLEAILTTGPMLAPLPVYFVYLFDRQGTKWNEVGSLTCSRQCDPNNVVRVQKLTDDSPPLVLFYRDLGGSASTLFTTTGYELHEGKLWPAMEVANFVWGGLPPPEREWHRTVLASKDRLVIHTVPSASTRERETCEVQRWDAQSHQFVPVPADSSKYCDTRTGKPLPGKAYVVGLPVVP